MREFAASMSVPRIQQHNGHGPKPADPMAEAVQRRRQLMATRMEEATASQLSAQELLDAQRQKLEAQELELQAETVQAKLEAIRAERRQLAAAQGGAGGMDGALGAMLQVFTDSQARLVEAAEKREQTLLALLNDRIEAAAQQAREAPPPPPALPTLAERVQELKALLEITDQLRPRQPDGQGMAVHDRIALEKFQLEADERRHALAQQAALQVRQLQGQEQHRNGELQLRAQQVAAEIDRNKQMGNLIEQLGPGVLAAVAQQLGGAGEGGGQQTRPPGDLRRCGSCGGEFLTRPEERGHLVPCPHCHVVVQLPADG